MSLNDSTGGIQHGGQHYKGLKIQPVDYAEENNLTMTEGTAIKYISRHRFSGKGMGDLKKAFHFLQMLARRYYGVEVKITFSDDNEDPDVKAALEAIQKVGHAMTGP